jgi:hypothetical protein
VRARARARVRACRSWKSILHVQTRLSWSSVVIFHTNAHAHTCTFTYIYITRMRHCTWYVSLNRCHARDIYPFVYPESISAQVYFRHKTARSRRLSRGHIILLSSHWRFFSFTAKSSVKEATLTLARGMAHVRLMVHARVRWPTRCFLLYTDRVMYLGVRPQGRLRAVCMRMYWAHLFVL